MKLFISIAISGLLGFATVSHAEMKYVGATAYTELASDYFYVALYMENQPEKVDLDSVLSAEGEKSFEFRFSNDYSLRRWTQLWRQLLVLNTDKSEMEVAAKEVLAFIDLFKGNLERGDTISVINDQEGNTRIQVNTVELYASNNPDLFGYIGSMLIGDTPPSLVFKQQLIGAQVHADAFAIVQNNAPPPERVDIALTWKSQVAAN